MKRDMMSTNNSILAPSLSDLSMIGKNITVLYVEDSHDYRRLTRGSLAILRFQVDATPVTTSRTTCQGQALVARMRLRLEPFRVVATYHG